MLKTGDIKLSTNEAFDHFKQMAAPEYCNHVICRRISVGSVHCGTGSCNCCQRVRVYR